VEIGFVAFWRNTPCEYCASPSEELGTSARIQSAFRAGDRRGIVRQGVYQCRWGSAWQYFTFWLSPNWEALASTIADLEVAGDFKFADSRHFVGTMAAPSSLPSLGSAFPAAAAVLRWKSKVKSAVSPTPLVASAGGAALADGVRVLGPFTSSFVDEWDGFSIWTAPTIENLAWGFDQLERRGLFRGTNVSGTSGNLALAYRFGNHLQRDHDAAAEESQRG